MSVLHRPADEVAGLVLIAQEAHLYQDAGLEPGQIWRQWTVVERRTETPDVVSFLLRPADGRPAPRARAGQYVSVRLRMPDGVHQLRQYSLSSDPGGHLRRITVKRVAATDDTPDGEVSHLLHHYVHVGDELTLSAPFGDVVLDDPAESTHPIVLVSAGIGCTPMTGMPAHLADIGSTRPVLVLHADHSPADHALRTETRDLVEQLPDGRAHFWYEHPGQEEPDARAGRMELEGIELPDDATVFLCGPLPFPRDVRGQLLRAGVPTRRFRYAHPGRHGQHRLHPARRADVRGQYRRLAWCAATSAREVMRSCRRDMRHGGWGQARWNAGKPDVCHEQRTRSACTRRRLTATGRGKASAPWTTRGPVASPASGLPRRRAAALLRSGGCG